MTKSIIESSIQRGFKRGFEQGFKRGFEQGKIQGRQAALLQLLQHRFPNVPDAVITRVQALHSLGELDALFKKTLTAENLEDIE